MLQNRFLIFFACFVCTLFSSCQKRTPLQEKRIGLDTSWFPLYLPGRESNVTGFSTDLLKEIAKIEKLSLVKVSVNWDDLVEGLQKQKYDAILSSIPPYPFNQKIYDFSEVFLPTGPVLVVPFTSQIDSLKTLKNKEVAVLPETNGSLLLEKYPSIIIRNYDSIPKAFDDILKGSIDAAIVDVLSAKAFCQDLYQGELKIATPPLNNEGLRLIALHNKHANLIHDFNQGLNRLKSSHAYDKLLLKWGLK